MFFLTAYGVRSIGYKKGSAFMKVDELVPEIIVPDLTGFKVEIVVVVIDFTN